MRLRSERRPFGRFSIALLVMAFAGTSGNWVPPSNQVWAATPTSGSLSESTPGRTRTWTGRTLASNPVFNPTTCGSANNCDVFDLTINVSQGFRNANPGFVVFVRIEWNSAVNDYDLFIRKPNGEFADSGQGFTNFEEVMLPRPDNGTYRVFAHSFATTPGTEYSGSARLLTAAPAADFRTAAYRKDPDGKFGPQMFQLTSDLRLIGAQGGNIGQNVEPEIAVNRFGTIYVSAIQGVPAGTDFWRSRDGGESFLYMGQPDGAQRAANIQRGGAGGGDTDLAVGAPFALLEVPGLGTVSTTGIVNVSSLWLGSSTMANSIDEGETFAVSQLPVPIHDRQWNTTVATRRVYATARQLGVLLTGTTSLFVVQSDDGGFSYPRGAWITFLFTTEEKERLQGNVAAFPAPGNGDPPNSTVYNVYTGRSRDELFLAKCAAPCNLPTIVQDTSGAIVPTAPKSFIVRRIFKAPPGTSVDNVFPVVATDDAGGVHVAFGDKKSIYIMSSNDRGNTWTKPVQVNNPADPETATALFPWIFAGARGRVGVMWYGTDRTGDADSEGQFIGAEWKLFYAFTSNAFANSPAFDYVAASGMTNGTDQQRRGVVHVGSICTRGLACNTATPPGNRNLAEYSSLTGDNFGLANIVVAADVSTPNNRARTNYIKQLKGPSALSPADDGNGANDDDDEIDGAGEFEDANDADSDDEHFGFNIRAGRGGRWSGSVTYLDKAERLLMTAETITSVTVSGNRATIIGSGNLENGRRVTFTLAAVDNSSSGAGDDLFAITLSSGYRASGRLVRGQILKH